MAKKKGKRRPKVVGMTLCSRVERDPRTGEFSLVGLFLARGFRAFPTPPQRFFVYSLFYGGIGGVEIELKINRLETEEEFSLYQQNSVWPGSGLPNYLLRSVEYRFPAPGRYRLSWYFDGEEEEGGFCLLDIRKDPVRG